MLISNLIHRLYFTVTQCASQTVVCAVQTHVVHTTVVCTRMVYNTYYDQILVTTTKY